MGSSLVGYMGYDMVRLMERLPDVPPDPIGVPDGMFVRPTIMLIFDSIGDHVTIVTPVWPAAGIDAAAAYEAALERLADVTGDRSEEPTSELQSLMRLSYAVFSCKKTKVK